MKVFKKYQVLSNNFRYRALFTTLILYQLGLVFYFEPAQVIFDDKPNAWLDFDTHIEQTWRVTEALHKFGKSWAYDVQLLAGYPNGTIFDADNKGWELWTYALFRLGLPKGLAFNLFILLAHLALPWVLFYAARLFGLSKWTSLLVMAMGMLLWYFDTFPRWCWWVGMTAYGLVGYLILLPLALFYRFTLQRRLRHLLLLTVTLGAALLIHPYTFVILVLPMSVVYVQAFRTLRLAHHLSIVAAVLAVLALNAYWLIVAFRFWHYILDSAYYAQSTLSFLFTDYLGLLKEPLVTGVMESRTGLRFVVFWAAIFGFALLRKRKSPIYLPLAIGWGAMIAVTYLGGYFRLLSQIQPYRHILPAMYLSLVPAALFFEEILASAHLKKVPGLALAVGSLGLLLALQSLAQDALYFLPQALPTKTLKAEDRVALQQTNRDVPKISGYHMLFQHAPTFADFDEVAGWVNDHVDDQGRLLVEWWVLGEHLTWRTKAEILGGFLERNLAHSAANLFRRLSERAVSRDEVRRYVENYAVQWAIISRPQVKFDKYLDIFEPIKRIDPIHRIYRTRFPVSLFAKGKGTVHASLNRIEVSGTTPDEDVVLKYHWLETLICKTGCRIEREPMPHDPVGFIRIPSPHPPDFVIENGY